MSHVFRPNWHNLPLCLGSMPDSAHINRWLATPLGTRVLAVETGVLGEALSDVVGFELLQVGSWGSGDAISRSARTQHRRWLAPDAVGEDAIRAQYDALPIATNSVEAVVLPHTLEYAAEPHQVLREVERVLVGDGVVAVCGFNPVGPWGVRHLLTQKRFPPSGTRLLSEGRLKDWLRLLGLEVVATERYLFTPPWAGRLPGEGIGWLESRGPRALLPLAGAYLIKARKRVHALTPLRPAWHTRPAVVGGIAEPTSRNTA
jgi:SAM-dependent methyltransferase